jgi:hypothetical protein
MSSCGHVLLMSRLYNQFTALDMSACILCFSLCERIINDRGFFCRVVCEKCVPIDGQEPIRSGLPRYEITIDPRIGSQCILVEAYERTFLVQFRDGLSHAVAGDQTLPARVDMDVSARNPTLIDFVEYLPVGVWHSVYMVLVFLLLIKPTKRIGEQLQTTSPCSMYELSKIYHPPTLGVKSTVVIPPGMHLRTVISLKIGPA